MTEIKGTTGIILSPPDEIAISYVLKIEENKHSCICDVCMKEKKDTVVPHIKVEHITVGKEETDSDNDVLKAVDMLERKWHEGETICRLCWGEILYVMEDEYAHDGQIFFKAT